MRTKPIDAKRAAAIAQAAQETILALYDQGIGASRTTQRVTGEMLRELLA